nr:reverse transcriptase domain-containing protein [Tanacetum cinerariifolium]
MSTRSAARNIFPPLDNPELTIRRRSHADPTLLNDLEMAAEGNGDPPVPDLQTMVELCQPSLNGRGGPTVLIAIQATNFGLKNDMIQQFPPSMVTKLRNEITNFRQHPDESLFEAWERYKLSIDRCLNHNMLLVTQIDTLYNGLTLRHRDTINAAAGGTFMKRHPEECYDLIENMTAHHNDWDTSAQRSESSSSITSSSDPEIIALKAEMAKINKNLMRVLQFMKMNTASSSGSGTLPVERETEATKDMVHPTNNGSTEDIQPLVVLTESPILNSEPVISPIIEPVASPVTENPKPNSEPIVAPIIGPVVAPVSALKPNQKPSIPYPSRLHDQKLRDKANDQKEKIFQIFQDLNFNISFADALILMPKFGPSIKTLLTNKDKLSELARTLLNEHCLAVLLKKLPEKLGDPDKFLIPCDFPGMDECLAL